MIKTKHSTWSPQWSDTQHELFRDFGFAAFTAQMLEASIIQILLAANYAGYIRLGNPIDIDSTLARKTLGHLTKLMEERGLIDARLTELLRDALEARNELIHQFFVINGDFLSDEGRGQMLKRLKRLRFRIGRAQTVFSQIRERVYQHFFGITRDAAFKLYQDRVANQATEDWKGC